MSSIDERIVQMQFQNDQFQKGITQTTDSLDKLKQKLDLTTVKDSLSGLSTSANKVDLGHISDGLDTLTSKFSAMGTAGLVVLANLANAAYNTGASMVKSLTIEPVMQGYSDYEKKLTSIQTITAATGKTTKEVEVYFNELDTYADQTIYNLSDMTSAFAKFTNAGVALEDSVPAIKGIANMTALAGQGANSAAIAYYNLSQSIAGGFLTRMDYRSLSQTNIATKEWQLELIKSGLAAGKLKKSAKGIYTIPGESGAYTAASLFTEGLQKQWATTEVLLDTLGRYGDVNTDIGFKAMAAAQDVKSLGMMMETLAAGVGTGFTDTFQIVIGDLDEAKKLWTGVTTVIQDFLRGISNARNEILQTWKDLGGRTELIDSLSKMFSGLFGIINSIGLAFQDIFPPTTGKQLYDLTIAFKKFVDRITPSAEALNNLRRTMRGLFSVFGIAWEIIKAVAKSLFDLIGFTTEGADGILGFTGNIGDFIFALHNAIKAGDGIGRFFTGIAGIIKIPIAILKTFVLTLSGLFEALTSFGTISMADIGAKLKERFAPLGDFGTALTNIWNGVADTFKRVGKFMEPIIKAVSDGIKSIGDAFVKSFSAENYDAFLQSVNTGIFGALVTLLSQFFGNGGIITMFDQGFVANFKHIFQELSNTLAAFTNQQNAKALVSIAIALGILAASLIGLSLIDPARLTGALGAMTAIMVEMFGALQVLAKVGGTKGLLMIPTLATSLILFATAIGVLTTSVIRMSKLSWEDIIKGLVGTLALLAALVVVSKLMGPKAKGMLSASVGLIAIAYAVKILANAIADLAKLSWDKMIQGIQGLGIILLEITIFNRLAKASKGAIKNAISIVILASALKILASAVNDLSNIDPAKITQGLVALGVILIMLSKFTKATANVKTLISTSIGLVIMAAAVKILASAISDLGNMDLGKMTQGIIGMGIALKIISMSMASMPKNMIFTATGLVIAAAGILIMANALKTLGGMNIAEAGTAILLLASSLTILSIALMFMNGSLAGAGALLMASAALAILAPVLLAFSKLDIVQVGIALAMLAGSLAIIAGAGYLLIGALPGLIGLGVATVLFGAGALMAGAGVMLLATALIALGGAAVIGTATLVTMVTAVINLIPLLMMKIGEGLIQILNVIANSTVAFIGAFTAIITAILQTIIDLTPKIVETVVTVIWAILKMLVDNTPRFIAAGMDIIIAFLDGIAKKLPTVIAKAAELIKAFVKGVRDALPGIIDEGIKLVISFIEGIADGIKNNTASLVKAGSKMFRAIVDGIAKAVEQGGADINYAGKKLGDALLLAAKKSLGIASPSKEFYKVGEFVTQGLVNGLNNTSSNVAKSAANLGNTAVDGINKSIAKISTMAMSTIDMNPTIKPVLDLSSIQKDATAINSMLTPSTISVDTAYNQASSIAADQQAAQAVIDAAAQEVVKTGDTTISFVQNNNSPKALSPAEIYRQTRNQISAAKGNITAA